MPGLDGAVVAERPAEVAGQDREADEPAEGEGEVGDEEGGGGGGAGGVDVGGDEEVEQGEEGCCEELLWWGEGGGLVSYGVVR